GVAALVGGADTSGEAAAFGDVGGPLGVAAAGLSPRAALVMQPTTISRIPTMTATPMAARFLSSAVRLGERWEVTLWVSYRSRTSRSRATAWARSLRAYRGRCW